MGGRFLGGTRDLGRWGKSSDKREKKIKKQLMEMFAEKLGEKNIVERMKGRTLM